MKFLKPKFWDEKKISLFSILLYPISLVFVLIGILRKNLIKKNSIAIPTICVGNSVQLNTNIEAESYLGSTVRWSPINFLEIRQTI